MSDQSPPEPGTASALPTRPVRVLDIPGEGLAAGRAYGEACRDMIQSHVERVIERRGRLRSISEETLFARAMAFAGATKAQIPEVYDEIAGIAEGAGIPVEAAWLLQTRAEVTKVEVPECTSIGAQAPATLAGNTIAGQNADLPPMYEDLVVMLRRTPPGRPRYLMMAPAGQVSWHGMNEHGVAVFANYINTGAWKLGIPRYLYSYAALACSSVEEAVKSIDSLERAAPRNLLLADGDTLVDMEIAPDATATLHPDDGILTHTNHLVSELEPLEAAPAPYVEGSKVRLARATALLEAARGEIDLDTFKQALRDREDAPDALSKIVDDRKTDFDTVTIASTIADIDARVLWVTLGAPHLSEYLPYEL